MSNSSLEHDRANVSRPRDVRERQEATRLPLRNFVALGSGELAARAIAFLVTATLARRLGTEGFGQLGFATAIASYLLLVPNLALQDLGARAVSRDPSHASVILGSVTRVRLLAGMGGALALVLLAALLPLAGDVRALLMLNALVVIPIALNASWVEKAMERSRAVGLALVTTQTVFVLAVMVLVHGPADLLRVPPIQAAAELVGAMWLLRGLRRAVRDGSLSHGLAVLRGAGAMIATRLLRAVIVTADIVLLGFLVAGEQVGLYSAAYRVCFLLTAIASSAHVVFQPRIMRAHDDAVAASRVLTDAVWMSFALGAPLVAGGIFVAGDLLALLFGEPYRSAAPAFRLLLLSIGVLFLHGCMQAAFVARHRMPVQTGITAAAAVLNVALNLLLIAPLGIVGAAIATLAAEVLILVATIVILWRWRWRPAARVLRRPALATALMLAVLAGLPTDWPVLVRIAIGAILYIIGLGALGGLPPQFRAHLVREAADR